MNRSHFAQDPRDQQRRRGSDVTLRLALRPTVPQSLASAMRAARDLERRLLLLGRDHPEYGRYEIRELSPNTAAAITVGRDLNSPSRQFKGDPAIPNEDGLLVIEERDRILIAVADAHFGHHASHDALAWIAEAASSVPEEPERLAALLAALSHRESAGDYASRTALLVVAYDRARRHGFGVSFGDCTCALVGANAAFRLNARDAAFASPADPPSLAPERGAAFQFDSTPNDLLAVFTDGIDGCHYGQPATSVRLHHLTALRAATARRPAAFTRALIELAMRGVDGHPGGQDNIALVITRT